MHVDNKIPRIKLKNYPSLGFTLIEILLVVTIMTVAFGLAIPNFSQSFKNVKLQTTAQDIAYLMRYALSRAITRNCHVQIQFNTELNQYWLSESKSDQWSDSKHSGYQRFEGKYGRDYDISEGIDVKGDLLSIEFKPNGRMDKARVYICREDRCFTISTKEQLGQVKIYESKIE